MEKSSSLQCRACSGAQVTPRNPKQINQKKMDSSHIVKDIKNVQSLGRRTSLDQGDMN